MMNLLNENLLTLILFSPVLGMLAVMLVPSEQKQLVRRVALVSSLITFALSIILWFSYDSSVSGFQFEEQAQWYTAISSSYHVGVDGISVPMILLTTLLMPIGVLASFGIEERVKSYMLLFLMLETGMLGVFMALDLIVFFLFWEIGLVPMYLLINIWGSPKGEREFLSGKKVPARQYASYKFFVYTLVGSLGLLLAIQILGVVAGSFDLITLMQV